MDKASSIKNILKTPSNVEEIKSLYKQNDLVYYTPWEEVYNASSHAFGIVFGFIMLIAMSIKATTPASIATAIISPIFIMLMYACSTAYHTAYNIKVKRILRRIDYGSINLTVLACGTGACLLYGNKTGYILFAVACLLSLIMLVLCLTVFNKVRYLAVFSNFVIGALLASAYVVSFSSITLIATGLFIAGLAIILVGACIFGVKARYIHSVFHLFVLLGPMLCIIANYCQLS